jgi:hypothetical protein
MSSRFESCVVLLVLASAATVSAQPVPTSGEFQVNNYTPFNQSTPVVAADGQGGFVVVWEQQDDMGMPDEIIGRRFDSSGNALDLEFHINTYTTSRQRSAVVARSAAGSFVVVWASAGQDGSAYGIFGRRFDATGNAQATEFQVSTFTSLSQSTPRVAMGGGGEFVVVWNSYNQDGSNFGAFGRRFDAAGAPLATEFQINQHTPDDQQGANVFLKSDGSFIVTWFSDLQDGSSSGAFARRFDSGGSPVSGEFQLNAYTTNSQSIPVLAYDPSDGFIAAWQSQQDGSSFGIIGRRFNSTGQPLRAEFQINGHTPDTQGQPVLLPMPGGAFVVVWHSNLQDSDDYGVFARAFKSAAEPNGNELRVNTTFAGSQRFPRAAANGQRFVVVWQSANQDGQFFGVFGRLFLLAHTLDVDGDGQVLPLTDSLLILRYTFGFRGATLITGAVGPQCSRCDAPSIEDYLDQI